MEKELKDYKSIDEILDVFTTDINGNKINYSDIGNHENNYQFFKTRYEFFKNRNKELLPDFTDEEILKFYKSYNNFREIFKMNGFDRLFTIFEWELITKNKK